MKINKINFLNYQNNVLKNNNTPALNRENKQSVCDNKLNPMEMLGRSQVTFKGTNNDNLSQFDKSFCDDILKNLELSKNDSYKFKKNVNQFLKNNNYSSPENFCMSCNTDEKYCSFIESAVEGLNLSEEKIVMLDNALMNKIMMIKLLKVVEEDEELANIVMPIAINAAKNSLICDNLIKKFNLDKNEQENILSQLKRLEQGVSLEQIAYEITEAYNLYSKDDFDYIVENLKSKDEQFANWVSRISADNDG